MSTGRGTRHLKLPQGISDFYAYLPTHRYIFAPTLELWPAGSVNARLPAIQVSKTTSIKASAWLDSNQAVEQMVWVPGQARIIKDRLMAEGGWMDRAGGQCFNTYRPAERFVGTSDLATPWLELLRELYPNDADHILFWFAHRVQRPGEKINHALVLGGAQGIGKDTLLEPLKHAVGPWNFMEAQPSQFLGRFNGFAKSVVLRVSEVRDLGEADRKAFYEHSKVYTAAPPDVLRCDEKNVAEHAVANVCGVIFTTNHKLNGIYLPDDDRRHYVAWSDRLKEDKSSSSWLIFYKWYRDGGIGHVCALLASIDLSGFDSKAPPPQTAAFKEIVNANRPYVDNELRDAIASCGSPPVLTLAALIVSANRVGDNDLSDQLHSARHRRRVRDRMYSHGYIIVGNNHATDGLWAIDGKRQAIYGSSRLSADERYQAAMDLCK